MDKYHIEYWITEHPSANGSPNLVACIVKDNYIYREGLGVALFKFVCNLLNNEAFYLKTQYIDDIHGMALAIEAYKTAIDVCSNKRQSLAHWKEESIALHLKYNEISNLFPQDGLEIGSSIAANTLSQVKSLIEENEHMNTAILSREKVAIDMYVNICKVRKENKGLRQQLADALGADITTADSLNVNTDFRTPTD